MPPKQEKGDAQMTQQASNSIELWTLIFSGLATVAGVIIAVIQLVKRPLRPATQEQVDIADTSQKIVQSALDLNEARAKMVDEMKKDIEAMKLELTSLRNEVRRIPALEKENAELKERNKTLEDEVEALRIRIHVLESKPVNGKDEAFHE